MKRTEQNERAFQAYRETVTACAPYLCGECSVCLSAGCAEQRLDEYLVNLDDGELPSIVEAVAWVQQAYPACPIGAVITSVVREMVVSAAFDCPIVSPTYRPPWRCEPAELDFWWRPYAPHFVIDMIDPFTAYDL